MSSRVASAIRDAEYDEISIVDRPAAQHAAIMISKSLGAEMDEFFTEDGSVVEFDEDGIPLGVAPDAKIFALSAEAIQVLTAEAEEAANAQQLVGAGPVGKKFAGRSPVGKSLADELRDEIAKAVTDDSTRSVLAKAMEVIRQGEERTEELAKAFEAERDVRLTAEYIEVAKSYGALPVSPDVLGPVLKRAAEVMSDADCAVLNKVFDATGSILFEEFGYTGGGTPDGSDPMAVVEEALAAGIAKSADGQPISKAHQVESFFTENPAAYEDYINSKARG
jgi:hypothetical protein